MTETDPTAPTLAGNVPDPDAVVLDSLVEQEAFPPAPDELPRDGRQTLDAPRRTNRLITGVIQLDSTWAPVLALPADPDRIALKVQAYNSAGASRVIYLADDPSKLLDDTGLSTSQAVQLRAGSANIVWLILDGYTGPLWAFVQSTSASAVTLTFAAVTGVTDR